MNSVEPSELTYDELVKLVTQLKSATTALFDELREALRMIDAVITQRNEAWATIEKLRTELQAAHDTMIALSKVGMR